MALPEGVEYYTVAEVAEHLRISPMSVYRYTRSGELPSVRMGKTVRIPAAALAAFGGRVLRVTATGFVQDVLDLPDQD